MNRKMKQTHWPHDNIFTNTSTATRLENGKERERPLEEPLETDLVLKLAGKTPY
jgi:hypothetical protein